MDKKTQKKSGTKKLYSMHGSILKLEIILVSLDSNPNVRRLLQPPGSQAGRQLVLTDGGGWWTGRRSRKNSSILKISQKLLDIFF